MLSRLISCFAMAAALASSLNVSAATGGTEVALFTPWSFIQKKLTAALTAQPVTDSQTLPALDLVFAPWTPHLLNVGWDARAKLEMISFTPQAVQLRTKQLAVTITIQDLVIDQVIEREVGGAIIRVRVQAQCGPITMTQTTAQMEARFAFDVQPRTIATKLEAFSLAWQPGSWQVSEFQCQGPGGFDQSMKAELVEELRSSEKARPWIESMIATRVQNEAARLVAQLASPIPVTIEKNNLVLQFLAMENLPAGILNRGTFVWSGMPGESALTPLAMPQVPDSVLKRNTPVFISPSEGWTSFISFLLQTRPSTFDINLKSIKAFKDLLASPSQQSVVWPDLQNYTTSSRFNLAVSRPRAYTLSWKSDGTAAVQSPASAMIQSDRSGRAWNYISLSGSVTGRLAPAVSGGKLNASVKFSKSRFTPRFEPGYVAAFSPNTTLDSRVLDAFSNYVNEGFQYSAALPAVDLGYAGKASFVSWTGISKELIGMGLELK